VIRSADNPHLMTTWVECTIGGNLCKYSYELKS